MDLTDNSLVWLQGGYDICASECPDLLLGVQICDPVDVRVYQETKNDDETILMWCLVVVRELALAIGKHIKSFGTEEQTFDNLYAGKWKWTERGVAWLRNNSCDYMLPTIEDIFVWDHWVCFGRRVEYNWFAFYVWRNAQYLETTYVRKIVADTSMSPTEICNYFWTERGINFCLTTRCAWVLSSVVRVQHPPKLSENATFVPKPHRRCQLNSPCVAKQHAN